MEKSRVFSMGNYLLEKAFSSDFSLLKLGREIRWEISYTGTARNFNPMMAAAGKITIAEVEVLVENGSLDPNEIHTPNIYVDRIFEGKYEKRIEKLTTK